jgi:predicted DNA-binding transcriptional regulator AlpA
MGSIAIDPKGGPQWRSRRFFETATQSRDLSAFDITPERRAAAFIHTSFCPTRSVLLIKQEFTTMKSPEQDHDPAIAAARAASGTDEVFLNSNQIRQRYGVTEMGLWRWMKEEKFPTPMTIGNRRYWKLSDIQAFEIRQTSKPVKHLDQINAARKSKKQVKAKRS